MNWKFMIKLYFEISTNHHQIIEIMSKMSVPHYTQILDRKSFDEKQQDALEDLDEKASMLNGHHIHYVMTTHITGLQQWKMIAFIVFIVLILILVIYLLAAPKRN